MMKHDKMTVLGGSLKGLRLPKSPEIVEDGSLMVDANFLYVRKGDDWEEAVSIYTDPVIDPFAASVAVLAHFDNAMTNAATNTNLSYSGATYTTAIKKFGTHGLAFPNNTAYVSVPISTFTNITVEMWVRIENLAQMTRLFSTGSYTSAGNSGVVLSLSQYQGRVSTSTRTNSGASSGTGTIAGSKLLQANTWHHVALTIKNGGVARIYIDGEPGEERSILDSGKNIANTGTRIGASADGPYGNGGYYMDEFVLTNAIRYTGKFIPRTTPYKLK